MKEKQRLTDNFARRTYGFALEEKGTVLIVVAVALTVLLSMTALAVDLGLSYLEKTELQNAIDAAALAGANRLPNTALATQVANEYVVKNGFLPQDISISFSQNNTVITVSGSSTVEYGFAKIMGFENEEITGSSAAQMSGAAPPAFDYVLFSGSSSSNLILNGANSYAGGKVHTNSAFILNGSGMTITGSLSAVRSITINGAHHDIPVRLPFASSVPMPDYSAEVKAAAEAAGKVYTGGKVYNGNVSISDSIYVKGGDINVNSSNFTGEGMIMCENSIVFNGRTTYQNNSSAVCFYSEKGNITLNGGADSVYGILYAPKGTVIINGTATIHGRIIANNIICNGKITISEVDDKGSLPGVGGKAKLIA